MARVGGAIRRAPFLALASLALGACADAFAPTKAVPGAVGIAAPAVYATWWAQVESCSGRTADLRRISWFAVPEVHYFEYRREEYNGYWWGTHDIVLAGRHVLNAYTVRHEMLHDLLDVGEHPAEFFDDRCGALVS